MTWKVTEDVVPLPVSASSLQPPHLLKQTPAKLYGVSSTLMTRSLWTSWVQIASSSNDSRLWVHVGGEKKETKACDAPKTSQHIVYD